MTLEADLLFRSKASRRGERLGKRREIKGKEGYVGRKYPLG